MTKKTIILVLIALLILNTFYWLNLIVQKSAPKPPILLGRRIDWDKVVWENYTFSENLAISLGDWELSKGLIMLLVITDAVLIAISSMIILLYKNI